jgi:hypothetical protein
MAVERIYERDIDIMLAEEFEVSPEFAAWFLKKTKFSDVKAHVKEVFVSKTDSTGESDLVAVFKKDDSEDRIALLIEDKIDAMLQPEQENRYRLRAKAAKEQGEFSDYEVILCSPQKYRDMHLDEVSTFDRFVSYEMIADFMRSHDAQSRRSLYRAELIATAAKKCTSSWVRIDDPATNDFWAAAYEIAKRDFPELEMHAPKLTKGSSWLTFRPQDLPTRPRSVLIEFKCRMGQVDLTFSNTDFSLFKQKVEPLLQVGMSIHKAGKSATVRIGVEAFKVSVPDEVALSKVRAGFAASVRLINFYRNNKGLLDKAAAESLPGVA